MKVRKKLFLKIAVFISSLALAITCISLNTHAYTYNQNNNIVYSDNALPFFSPYKISAVKEYHFTNYYEYGSSEYTFNYNTGYTFDSFRISIYNGLTDNDYVDTIYSSTSIYGSAQVSINIFNNNSLTYNITNYSDYYVRFLIRSKNSNNDYQYSYLMFSFGDMFNYFSQFKDVNYNYQLYILKYSWNGQYSGQSREWFYIFGDMGFYAQDTNIIEDNYYAYNGEYSSIWNNGEYSEQQDIILDLTEQNNALTKQIDYLSNELANAQNNKMRSLIWTIGATPFESFKTIWDINIWGLNIGGIVIGGLLALLIVYLIKKVWK